MVGVCALPWNAVVPVFDLSSEICFWMLFEYRVELQPALSFTITSQLARPCAPSAATSSRSATATATPRARTGTVPARSG